MARVLWLVLAWAVCLAVLWTATSLPAYAQDIDETTALKEAAELHERSLAYYEQGRYDEAVPLAQRAVAKREKALGPWHPDLALSLNNLAMLYQAGGEYTRAAPLYERALAINENSLGPWHPAVATSLNNLATLYQARGEYARAAPLYERTLAIEENALGPWHPAVATSLNNLAMLYRARGEYARAAPLLERALAMWEKSLGPRHPDVARALNNLAELYQARGEYTRAAPLLERALAIEENALGPWHPDVATALNNLAALYRARGKYTRAALLYERALAIREKTLGSSHPEVATALNNLAELYQARGEYTHATSLLERALAIREKTLGSSHPAVATVLNNLAALYDARGQWKLALESLVRSLEITEQKLAVLLTTGSEDQKRARIATVKGGTSATVHLHLQRLPADPRVAHMALETILRRKGRVLDVTVAANQALLRQRQLDTESRALLEELGHLRSALAARLLRGPESEPAMDRARSQALWERLDTIEAELSQLSRQYQMTTAPVTVEEVQACLSADTALVELFLYRPVEHGIQVEPEDRWGAPRYAAYVLRAQGPPRAVDLGKAAPIDKLVARWRTALQERHTNAGVHARALDAQVMAPVRALLGDVEHLFLAPDGDLNLIPFAALEDESGRFLVERYDITYLTSGRDLLRLGASVPARQGPVLVVDPLYGTVSSNTSPADPGNPLDLVVAPLRGTAREAQTLAALLPGLEVWTGAEATEARLAQLRGPEIVHIATHGIWLPDVKKDVQDVQPVPGNRTDPTRDAFAMRTPPPGLAKTFDPMLRSGLALAGFNTGGRGAEDDNDDGFLTALETTSLDLHGTRLVVLSACDTGVGEVKSGQGVYGLRRALVVAGAETQVMSLWRVSDGATAYIMEVYYRNLRAGLGRSEAMRQVQLEMLKDPLRRHPFYWASFIVSGNPAPLDSGALAHAGPGRADGGGACDSASPGLPAGTAVLVLLAFLVARRPWRAR